MDRDTELAIVARLRQADATAFDEVYGRYHTPLVTFLARLARDRDAAEDLAEETWLRLVKHCRRLHADTRLAPWLFTVARHVFVSYRRSRMVEDSAAAGLMALWPCTAERTSPFEATAASELERRLERALASLPASSREVLLLVAVAGLDPSDAADVCGVTPETLRQRLHRAREALSKALARDAAAGGPAREGSLSCQTR